MRDADLWEPGQPLSQVVVRAVLVYVLLLVLLRISRRRHVGERSPTELLTMLLLAGTFGPALTAFDASLVTCAVAAMTLLAMNSLVAWLTFRSRTAERLLIGGPDLLIRGGKLDPHVVHKERMTDQEIGQALRQAGVEAVQDVERAYVEPDGDITVIRRSTGRNKQRLPS